jgi:isoleucyl-tRNA synthetase
MTSKVLAPVMPYLAENIYRDLNLRAEVPSVHLADWSETKELSVNEKKLLEEMALVRAAASAGLALRKAVNIPIRQPLAALRIKDQKLKLSEELLIILKDELNVKEITFEEKLANDFELDTVMTAELKLEGLVRGLERAIQEMRKKQGLAVGEIAELLWSTEDADLKKAISAVNREKTYLRNVREDASAAGTVTVDGKSIKLGLKK